MATGHDRPRFAAHDRLDCGPHLACIIFAAKLLRLVCCPFMGSSRRGGGRGFEFHQTTESNRWPTLWKLQLLMYQALPEDAHATPLAFFGYRTGAFVGIATIGLDLPEGGH